MAFNAESVDCIIVSAGVKIHREYASQIQRNLGPYRIASALENAGYNARVIDFTQYLTLPEFVKSIENAITEKTKWIGFSSSFFWGSQKSFPHWTDDETDFILTYLKQLGLKIVYGGVRSQMFNDDRIDCYVFGYADNAIIDVARKVIDGTLPKTIDSKDYPEPEMNNIKTHWWRKDFNILDGEALPLEMARGCIFKCKFCGYSLIGKKKGTYLRDVEEVRDDLIRTWEATGCTNYYITDDTFNDDNDKIEAIHKLFTSLPFKLSFSCYLRLDLINKYPDQADLLQEAGLVGNFFGIETLNKQSATAIGKGLSPTKVKDRLNWLGERWKGKVNMGAGLIFGLPYDTIEYFNEVEEWILDKDNPLSCIEVYPLMLFKTRNRNYGSEFSLNPEIYGYEVHDNNFWTLKQQGLDYRIVTMYADKVMSKRNYMNKVSEFQIMTQQNIGIPISEIMETRYVDLQTKFDVASKNTNMLNRYKNMIGVL
jgi:radical SAM superfamily enzyme YgiQ (UPF0313 family)